VKKEKSCGAVVYRKGDSGLEILLIKHKNGGHWAFPKGHVEKKETETETALREIREETGLKVKLDTGFREMVTYSPKPNVMKDVIYFAAKAKEDDARPQPEEVLEICWKAPEEALELVTYATDREILQAFLTYREQRSKEK
jgi:bis(5'-nucleosidyl)-tetraphosphatase